MLEFLPNLITLFQIVATIFIGIFVLFVSLFLKYAFRRHFYNKDIPHKPTGFFNLLGNSADLHAIQHEFPNINAAIIKCSETYNNLFKKEKLYCFWFSYAPFIVLRQAEAVEELVSGTKATKKAWLYKFMHPWLGTGLLTSDGPKWKSRRKLLTPSFHFEILKDFMPVFNEQSQKLVNILKKDISKDYVDIVKPLTLCSLDIICETTLGVNINVQENEESEYVKAVSSSSNMIIERMVSAKYWFDFTFQFTAAGRQHKKDLKLLHEFTRNIIREKKKKLLSGAPDTQEKKKRKALMDLLLEHHIQTKDMTEEDIREEIDTFAFEGHDTTSMGMSWALYLIGLHQDVQEKLQEEVDRIFGDDTERSVEPDDLKDMTYLDRVLKVDIPYQKEVSS